MLLLELLPVQTVLLLLTAGTGGRLADEPVPLPVNAAALLFAWLVGWALRRRRASVALFLLGVPCFALLYAGLILTSPVTYGGGGGGLTAAVTELANGSPHAGNMLGLLPVALYIWWRGYATGRDGLTAHGVMRRFQFGMAVVVLAAAGAAAVQGPARGELLGALAIILPIETFCGLVASALTRFTSTTAIGETDTRQAQGPEAPWLGVALTLSVVVVGFALLLSLIVNYESVGALLARLGPVGQALGAVVDWITGLIAQLLYLLLHNFVKPPAPKTPLPAPTPLPTGACVPTPANHECQTGLATLDPFWRHLITLIMQGTALVVLAVGLFVVLRYIIFRRWLFSPPQQGVEEERESLEAASLLGAQLRSLLGRLAPKRTAPAVDPLVPGTVRYVYRDVLRAAATAELARRSEETPDEFAERVGRTAPIAVFAEGQADLDALSAAYAAARYGEQEPDEATMGPLRVAAARLVRTLRRGS